MENSTASSPLTWRTAPSTPHTPEIDMLDNNDEMALEEILVKYRAAKQLPDELLMSCKIHLEEKLFANALSLENDLLTSSSKPDAPSFIPPISHIALISSLLVHPHYTTRAKDPRDRSDTLPKALAYLQNVLAIAGPGNAKLGEAFAFKSQSHRRTHVKGRRKNARDISPESDEGANEELDSSLATTDSVWERAQDFWHVVGWAFNCSVAYKERWEYWKTWLSYIIDVIEADWQERAQRDLKSYEQLKQTDPKTERITDARNDSILCQYISSNRITCPYKRLARSIFADGEGKFLNDFPEVFANETMMLQKDNSGRKRQKFGKVDVEKGDFGGYGASDDEDLEDISLKQGPTPPGSSPDVRDYHDTDDDTSMTLGGHESVTLRLRLMALLSRASEDLPNDARKIPQPQLFDVFTENLRPMPINSLSLFTCTNAVEHFPQDALFTLCQFLVAQFIDPKAPDSATYSLDVVDLVKCFLPWAAETTSADDNARLSILLETILRIYVKQPSIKYESSLEDFASLKKALDEGIKAREAKIGPEKRRKRTKSGSNLDDPARFWLKCSGERMRMLMPIYERKLMQARSDHESSQADR